MPEPYLYHDAPRLPEGPIEPRELVKGEGSVELEIGPGRGHFLVDRLEAHPEVRLIGLEIRRKWATLVDRRLERRGLSPRGRVFAEDARDAVSRFSSGSVGRIFIHFPDPWWKKRHQKRRVLTAALLDELCRVVEPGGELFVQTDVIERGEEYERLVEAHPGFEPFAGAARVEENPYGARSPREKRVIADGLPVVRLRYRRRR